LSAAEVDGLLFAADVDDIGRFGPVRISPLAAEVDEAEGMFTGQEPFFQGPWNRCKLGSSRQRGSFLRADLRLLGGRCLEIEKS